MNGYKTHLFFVIFLIIIFPSLTLGSQPKRPKGVAAKAKFHQKARVWILDKNNHRIVWNENGKIKAKGKYIGKREGIWVFYYKNGNLKGRGAYKKGKKVGEWTLYYPNGHIKAKGNFVNDYKSGHWRLYDPAGWLKSEGNYKYGYKHGKWIEYYSNGKVFYIGHFKWNKEDGIWKYFTLNGKLVESGRYKRGIRYGNWYVCVMGQCGHKTFKTSEIPGHSGQLPAPFIPRR